MMLTPNGQAAGHLRRVARYETGGSSGRRMPSAESRQSCLRAAFSRRSAEESTPFGRSVSMLRSYARFWPRRDSACANLDVSQISLYSEVSGDDASPHLANQIISSNSGIIGGVSMARLLSLRSLRVSGEEVPQHHQKLARALFVAATERVMDIVAHHVTNPLRSVWFF
jgi:hypothetical protein